MVLIKCWAWLPNLSGNIFLDSVETIKKHKFDKYKETFSENSDRNQSDFFKKTIDEYPFNYGKIKKKSDKKGHKRSLFIYQFETDSDEFPKRICIFLELQYRNYDLKAVVSILNFDERGLIRLELPDHFVLSEEDRNKILEMVYFDLVNYYSRNTYQFDDGYSGEIGDSLIDLSFSDDKSPAIKDILKFQQKKITTYLEWNQNLISGSQIGKVSNLEKSIKIRRNAKGCFIHFLNFIEYYKTDLNEDHEFYQCIFNNALNLLDAYSEDISSIYNSKSVEIARKLSMNQNIFGLLILIMSMTSSYILFTGDKSPYVIGSFAFVFFVIGVILIISHIEEIKMFEKELIV